MRKLVVAALVVAVLVPASASVAAADQAPPKDVRIVNLNLLHGIPCPKETSACQAPDRVALLGRQLEAADCPEVVGLQEVDSNIGAILDKVRKGICGNRYKVAFKGKPRSSDTERVLTTLPIQSEKILPLSGNFRTASRVVLKSRIGTVVLVVTHQDGDPTPVCRKDDPRCRPEPCPEGTTVGTCQTEQAEKLADEVGGKNAVRVLMGDFNLTSTNARYQSLIDHGWTDTHLLAGNTECDPTTSKNCTSGRVDNGLESLTSPVKGEQERIDFIFVKPSKRCEVAVDGAADADSDGIGTGLWNDEPTLDGPNGILWTSDHTGVSADLSCTAKD